MIVGWRVAISVFSLRSILYRVGWKWRNVHERDYDFGPDGVEELH